MKYGFLRLGMVLAGIAIMFVEGRMTGTPGVGFVVAIGLFILGGTWTSPGPVRLHERHNPEDKA